MTESVVGAPEVDSVDPGGVVTAGVVALELEDVSACVGVLEAGVSLL